MSVSYQVFPAEGITPLFRMFENEGQLTEKTLDELIDLSCSYHNVNLKVYIIPIRTLPLWGSDLRIDYFFKNTDCLQSEEKCEIFHATQNVHLFSIYRVNPTLLIEQNTLIPDFLDFWLSFGTTLLFCWGIALAVISRFSL